MAVPPVPVIVMITVAVSAQRVAATPPLLLSQYWRASSYIIRPNRQLMFFLFLRLILRIRQGGRVAGLLERRLLASRDAVEL
jgi:hypothetical protein